MKELVNSRRLAGHRPKLWRRPQWHGGILWRTVRESKPENCQGEGAYSTA